MNKIIFFIFPAVLLSGCAQIDLKTDPDKISLEKQINNYDYTAYRSGLAGYNSGGQPYFNSTPQSDEYMVYLRKDVRAISNKNGKLDYLYFFFLTQNSKLKRLFDVLSG